jgi:hypothetical protein
MLSRFVLTKLMQSARIDADFRCRILTAGGHEREIQTAAMQSISMSKLPAHAGTQTKIRAGGSWGK